MMDDRFRQARAFLSTAVTWGAAWAIAGGALVTVLALFNPDPGIESLVERVGLALMSGLLWGVRFGIAGAVIGTVFSTVIRLGYRGRRLADISPVRFAMLGAVVGGVGVPLFLQLMNVLSGDGPIAWGLVWDDAGWATVFGAAVAGGSIWLARRADALAPHPSPDQLEHDKISDAELVAGHEESPVSQSARASLSDKTRGA
jgi:MFS family permease